MDTDDGVDRDDQVEVQDVPTAVGKAPDYGGSAEWNS